MQTDPDPKAGKACQASAIFVGAPVSGELRFAAAPHSNTSSFFHFLPVTSFNMSSDLPYIVAFSHMSGIGMQTVSKLLRHYPSVKEIYNAPEKKLAAIIGPNKSHIISHFRSQNSSHSILESLLKKDIHIIDFTFLQKSSHFCAISPLPLCVYSKGDISLLKEPLRTLAIVGTRKPTLYGRRNASYFSAELSRAGFAIVSGLAYGIDSEAHLACLAENSQTIAVLGCGIEASLSTTQATLSQRILKKNGLILSEFPPTMQAQPQNFPIRNRLISGFSLATVVVEGEVTSGACITARYDASQGRDVFCIPGPIDSPNSAGPHELIKNGAYLATSPRDIIDMYAHLLPSKKVNHLEEAILKLLNLNPLNAPALANVLQASIQELLSRLLSLELAGRIRRQPDGTYMVQ